MKRVRTRIGDIRPFFLEEFETMPYPRNDEMIWFAGHWWWFPGRQISAESRFEWKNGRSYLLEADGSAVEGIMFAGEVSPE